MRLKSLVRRRPSAPMVVSFVALFVSLGGAGYAAVSLPQKQRRKRPAPERQRRQLEAEVQRGRGEEDHQRLGRRQAGELEPGAAARRRARARPARSRRSGCPAASPARRRCRNEYGSNTAAIDARGERDPGRHAVAGRRVLVPGAGLPARGDQRRGRGQHVEVDCTLSVPAGRGRRRRPTRRPRPRRSRSTSTSIGHSQAGTIPLVLPVASSTSIQPATVNCTDTAEPATPAPTVAVDTTISALQTASNN